MSANPLGTNTTSPSAVGSLVQQLAKRIDADNDGQISQNEFAGFLNNLITGLSAKLAGDDTAGADDRHRADRACRIDRHPAVDLDRQQRAVRHHLRRLQPAGPHQPDARGPRHSREGGEVRRVRLPAVEPDPADARLGARCGRRAEPEVQHARSTTRSTARRSASATSTSTRRRTATAWRADTYNPAATGEFFWGNV